MIFELLWVQYRHPTNRGSIPRAKTRYRRIVEHGQLDALLLALEGYKAYQSENKWYQAMQLATWLGSHKDERWKQWSGQPVEVKSQVPVAPLLDEAALVVKAEAIIRQRQRELEWWELDASKHFHSGACQDGKACAYRIERRPIVPEVEQLVRKLREGL